MIAVDHWKGSVEHRAKPEWAAMLPTLYETFVANTWEERHRIIPVREDSLTGLRVVAGSGVTADFVYIDASHEYPDVKEDICVAAGRFPGAILAGDDLDLADVRRAVEESFRSVHGRAGLVVIARDARLEGIMVQPCAR